MPPDIQKYRKYVDHLDLTEAQKVEFIHIVWATMESFADRAFGLHPVQLCGDAGRLEDTKRSEDGVDSNQQPISGRFKRSAKQTGRGKN